VAETAIRSNLDQTADVLGHFTAEVTLYAIVVLNVGCDSVDLVLRKIVRLLGGVDLASGEDIVRTLRSNTVDITEREAALLLARNVHTHESRHVIYSLLLINPDAVYGADLCK
jgi:hypothetical protein